MKTIASWNDLDAYGIDLLTGEACSLSYRLLCDLTTQGKVIVERCLSVTISAEPWNRGSDGDPHVASVMLTREMLQPLAVFALLDAGCREVWLIEGAVLGVENGDSAEQIEVAEAFYKPARVVTAKSLPFSRAEVVE